MQIIVRCENEYCDAFDVLCGFPADLAMAPGENIYCGTCGYPAEILSNRKPQRTLEFIPGMMNQAQPRNERGFKKGPATAHNIAALEE